MHETIVKGVKAFISSKFIKAQHFKHHDKRLCKERNSIYVTGYSKTNHNVTFGQLLFIGSANSHTHTLPMHCCINGLS